MSKNPLRKDKTCLNCRYVVENRFCPNCGQENIDTRKTFYQLFVHFFEDLTHYENAFWKTIKNLILKPATLTKEYLSGKRLSYLAPVRLYIFISLITFFLISVFSSKDFGIKTVVKSESKTASQEIKESGNSIFGYQSIKELDSIQKYGSKTEKLPSFQLWGTKKVLLVFENNTKEGIIKKFIASFTHNFPKLLFINLPIFALFLWILHNKKRWYYFDHGIFTLHYFSFLLLTVLILFLSNKIFSLYNESGFINFISGMINFLGFSWMIYYIFPAHHRFYGETRLISFLKTSLFLFIDFLVLIITLILFAFYTFINLQ
jgi:hypothetical protein